MQKCLRMNRFDMTSEEINTFLERIDKLHPGLQPRFGKMNVHQMICHCTDQLRLAMGRKKAIQNGGVNPLKILLLAKSGKTVPTPKGFDQVEGEGTKPVDFESDKLLLKNHILEFSKLPVDFEYARHPYFGKISSQRWKGLAVYHLEHHLSQFGV